MKSILILLVASASASAFGQAKLPMISSSGHLRAYALSQAAEVNSSIYSPSMLKSGYDSVVWTGQKTSEEILAALKSLRLSGQTVSTSDTVSVYASVNDRQGNTLFYGYGEAKPVLSNGSWSLPASAGNLSLVLAAQPLSFDKSASYAVVVAKDQNGWYRYYDVQVANGKAFFPPQLAGLKDAFLRVDFSDGTAAGYLVATGEQLPVSAIGAAVSGSFSDVHSFKNQGTIRVVVRSDGGIGVVPTIEVAMDAASSVSLLAITEEEKVPVRYWLKSGDGAWTSVPGAALFTSISFQKGVTYVIPEWDPKAFRENVLPPSGEKG